MKSRADITHPIAQSRRAPAPGSRGIGGRALRAGVGVVSASRSGERSRGAAAVLLERRPVSGDLLRLKLSRPPGFQYLPGQHVKMGLPGLLRTYSLVSAPHEADLEFFVELVPGGQLSERLRSVRAGAAMTLESRAKGDLRLDPTLPVHLMIATVTGIAPYVSMLRDHRHRPSGARRFIVLHGASFADEFGFLAELSALAQRHPASIAYVPTVSRPQSPRNRGWSGERGRVESLAEPIVRRFRLTPTDTAVYACGNPAMVSTVAALFRTLGFTTRTEPFD
jgi:ferredoxin/flavodoxin---NADP+ reductase